MLANTFKSFPDSYRLILKNKVNFILALIPVLIGIVLYYFLGKLIFVSVMEWGQQYINSYLADGTVGKVVYYIVATILTIMLYFIVNWTFVLLVTVIASPFNDILSMRVEKLYLNEKLPSFKHSFDTSVSKIFPILFNEFKKILFIIILSGLAFSLGYIPFLTPISIFIAMCLLAVEFLDYSWSRQGMSFKECRKDLKNNLLSYSAGGGFFMLVVAVPIINLIVPSLATSYFTILWIKNNEHRNQITQ